MAKNKIKLKTVIDNEMYVMSIVKEQIKNDWVSQGLFLFTHYKHLLLWKGVLIMDIEQ
jgi:hypothetical protein